MIISFDRVATANMSGNLINILFTSLPGFSQTKDDKAVSLSVSTQCFISSYNNILLPQKGNYVELMIGFISRTKEKHSLLFIYNQIERKSIAAVTVY